MAEVSVQTDTVREAPHLNPMGPFKVRRKAAKRSKCSYQGIVAALPPSTQAEVITARKKARLEESLPAATDQADRETAFPESSGVASLLLLLLHLLLLLPPAADKDENENAGPVTALQPNACATATDRWTLEEDAQVAKTKKKQWGKVYKIDWVAVAALVPGRTNRQSHHRWRNALDPSIDWANGRAGKCTEDEGLKLQDAVKCTVVGIGQALP
jgi:hypothetical protein